LAREHRGGRVQELFPSAMMKSLHGLMTFVDTSALYALADTSDANHTSAKEIFQKLLESNEELFTHNYIIVETTALLQHRLGFSVAEKFLHDISFFSIIWIDEHSHRDAVTLFISLKKRAVSFVDCTSFVLMRQKDMNHAFAFDQDFLVQGFTFAGRDE
jgi:predicted nucleic acid-binding protein